VVVQLTTDFVPPYHIQLLINI